MKVLVFILFALLTFRPDTANAWTCSFLDRLFHLNSQTSQTEAELLRDKSLLFAEHLSTRRDGEFVVFGRLFKTAASPFLHEEQLEGIRALYWPPSEAVQMPNRIEYTYLGAYRFEGHRLLDGILIQFVAEDIDARVSISSEYEGIVDLLPPTDIYVAGILRRYQNNKRVELVTSPCPTFYSISPLEQADLLKCFAEGACE